MAAAIPDSVPTAVTIAPFAFAGRGGRSKYLVPIDYWGFEPRIGFAWQPKMKLFGLNLEKRSVVMRGGYGISHATLTGNNRSPNPDFGGFVNVGTIATGSAAGATLDPTQPIRLSGNQPLQGTTGTLDSILGTDSNGLVFLKSLGVGAFATGGPTSSGKVPYSQNWNLTVDFEPIKRRTRADLADVRRNFCASRTRWRRGWDSNPRTTFAVAGFQDRCLQPLGHPSTPYFSSTYSIYGSGATI